MPKVAAKPAKWNAADYAANSTVQQSWARELIAKLKLHGHERILDVGCGDGKVTAELARAVPHGFVLGTDASVEMISFAKKTFPTARIPNLKFEIADAREIGTSNSANTFDLVFSNAALHWVDDHEAILRGAAMVLKPGGRLIVSCGGKGNAHDVFLALRPEMRSKRWREFFRKMPLPYFFYAPSDYEKWLRKFGFQIHALKLAPKDATYVSANGFATWLRTTWLPFIQRVPENLREEFIAAVTARYLAKHPPDAAGNVRVRMVRLEIDAEKLRREFFVWFAFFAVKFLKMKKQFKEISGSIVAPTGFLASGVFCDIKKLGTGKGSNKGQKRDLALIVSETPATVAGMFTTNQVCAAPVKVCVERLKKGNLAQVVVVNSGNANACTGKQGMADAREMVSFTEKTLALSPGRALVGSTGRIGVTMPMDNVRAGILEAAMELGTTAAHADRATEAIMTSDSKPKQVAVEFKLGGKTVRIGGICKGAGMIQPGMSATGARPAALPHGGLHATMLGFITTNAAVERKVLQAALNEAVAHSFNRITVDGDMSTNDTVLVLANSLAGNKKFSLNSTAGKIFQAALNHVCLELAKKIVRDGEGVHRVVTVRVNGAKTIQDADAAARAVANSALVKTSWHGGDPNWGRIIDAIGYSPATVVEEKIDIGYSAPNSKKILWSLKRGQPTRATFKELCAAVASKEFELHINLNLGRANAVMYAADLTEEYVDFNKGDVGDPTSLGG